MTDQLKAIRAEIERRLNKNKYSTAITEMVYAEEDENILSFIDSLPYEPSHIGEGETVAASAQDGLEEEINRYLREDCSSNDDPSVSEIARHFAEWGAEHFRESAKMIDKELEEAALEFEADHTIQTYDGGGLSPMEVVGLAEAFTAGAEWQKKQMMAKAIEGKVYMSFAPGHDQMVMADVDLPTNTKVKLIIIPQEYEPQNP